MDDSQKHDLHVKLDNHLSDSNPGNTVVREGLITHLIDLIPVPLQPHRDSSEQEGASMFCVLHVRLFVAFKLNFCFYSYCF